MPDSYRNPFPPMQEWFDALGGLTHVEDALYRSPIPWSKSHFDALEAAGIRVIYSMEEAVPGDYARDRGFDWRPHFWTDDAPPRVEEMDRFLADYLALPAGTKALVHCKAGWGRTGSAVACALMATKGLSADAALRHFWSRVPRAEPVMNRNGQSDMVRDYEKRLRNRRLD